MLRSVTGPIAAKTIGTKVRVTKLDRQVETTISNAREVMEL